ncbi:hypothetical protein SEUCBS139899_008837 [Sporothrix eucalyptigena]
MLEPQGGGEGEVDAEDNMEEDSVEGDGERDIEDDEVVEEDEGFDGLQADPKVGLVNSATAASTNQK